ncbi:MAG: hypothetical protein CM15mP39_05380 [Synechococcus sp.]|nr:MAG: hypothetical protein CM15mP39_05380 [Synechococcus sp.]
MAYVDPGRLQLIIGNNTIEDFSNDDGSQILINKLINLTVNDNGICTSKPAPSRSEL